jgi:hypothetical protein
MEARIKGTDFLFLFDLRQVAFDLVFWLCILRYSYSFCVDFFFAIVVLVQVYAHEIQYHWHISSIYALFTRGIKSIL